MKDIKNMIQMKTNYGEQTSQIGKKLGILIKNQMIFNLENNSENNKFTRAAIALYGGLGAGKTTFAQGFARGFGVTEDYYITSPTYNIINQYPVPVSGSKKNLELTLYHIDLYRLGSADELEYIGFNDIVSSEQSVFIIEWPGIVDKNSVKFDIIIKIDIDNDFNRIISFTADNAAIINLLKSL